MISSPRTPARPVGLETKWVPSVWGDGADGCCVRKATRSRSLREEDAIASKPKRCPLGHAESRSHICAVSADCSNNIDSSAPNPATSNFLAPSLRRSNQPLWPCWSSQNQAYLEGAEKATLGANADLAFEQGFKPLWKKSSKPVAEKTLNWARWPGSRTFWTRFQEGKSHQVCHRTHK